MLSKIKNLLPAIAVLIISSLLFLTGLGANSLADWDEAWYADASRFMFRHDHFLTPIWNGQYFFDKPPLQYWLTQPFLYLFDETELAYRLPSALAAIALTFITYLWGIRQKTSRRAGREASDRTAVDSGSAAVELMRADDSSRRWNNFTGLTASIILLTFPHFLDRGRSGNFDALFVFFATFSMFLMVKNRPALGGIFLGLSWLTKGVFSGLFPLAVFLVEKFAKLLTSQRGFANFKLKPLLIYIFFAVLIYAPWHLLEYTRFERLINQSYFAAFDQGEFGSWNWMDIAWRFDLRYLVFLWTFLRWWFPLLLISLIYQITSSLRAPTSRRGVAISLPLITFTVIFLALSAAKSKNDWYIMPAYPFIALMISNFISQIFRTGPDFCFSKNQLARPNPPTSRSSGRVRIVLKRPEVRLGGPKLRGRRLLPFIFIISISISNLYLYRRQAFPPDKWLPEKELGLTVKNLTGPSDLVVTAEYEFPSLRYYSEREIRTAARQPDYDGKYWWIWDNTDIATALRRGQNIVAIHRPGSEWPIDVYGYHREKLGESNHRVISSLLPNTPLNYP